mmetsp:Transcript_87082/g.224267  ORF Transcript_87082/g.224267 Transcript_87082/m.224267 type:complete len:626 (-) Transcript_87082:671-2548(-)
MAVGSEDPVGKVIRAAQDARHSRDRQEDHAEDQVTHVQADELHPEGVGVTLQQPLHDQRVEGGHNGRAHCASHRLGAGAQLFAGAADALHDAESHARIDQDDDGEPLQPHVVFVEDPPTQQRRRGHVDLPERVVQGGRDTQGIGHAIQALADSRENAWHHELPQLFGFGASSHSGPALVVEHHGDGQPQAADRLHHDHRLRDEVVRRERHLLQDAPRRVRTYVDEDRRVRHRQRGALCQGHAALLDQRCVLVSVLCLAPGFRHLGRRALLGHHLLLGRRLQCLLLVACDGLLRVGAVRQILVLPGRGRTPREPAKRLPHGRPLAHIAPVQLDVDSARLENQRAQGNDDGHQHGRDHPRTGVVQAEQRIKKQHEKHHGERLRERLDHGREVLGYQAREPALANLDDDHQHRARGVLPEPTRLISAHHRGIAASVPDSHCGQIQEHRRRPGDDRDEQEARVEVDLHDVEGVVHHPPPHKALGPVLVDPLGQQRPRDTREDREPRQRDAEEGLRVGERDKLRARYGHEAPLPDDNEAADAQHHHRHREPLEPPVWPDEHGDADRSREWHVRATDDGDDSLVQTGEQRRHVQILGREEERGDDQPPPDVVEGELPYDRETLEVQRQRDG